MEQRHENMFSLIPNLLPLSVLKTKNGKRIFFLFLLSSFPALLLIFLELFLSIFFPQPPRGLSEKVFIRRDNLFFMEPSVLATLYRREFLVHVEGNAHGYRKGTWPDQNTKAGKIVILGDSFAFGWGVEADESVSAILNRSAGYDYYNLAIPGDRVYDQMNRFKLFTEESTQVDGVLILLFDNDLIDEDSNVFAGGVHKAFSIVAKANTARLAARIADKIHVTDFLCEKYDETRRKDFMQYLASVHKATYWSGEKWKFARECYLDIIARARSIGAFIIVVRIPPPFLLCDTDDEKLVSILGENGYDVKLLDFKLNDFFSGNDVTYLRFHPPGDKICYYSHDMHLNADGHRLLASFILDAMERRKGLVSGEKR